MSRGMVHNESDEGSAADLHAVHGASHDAEAQHLQQLLLLQACLVCQCEALSQGGHHGAHHHVHY